MMALAACPSENDKDAPPGPVTNPMAADGASDGEVDLSWSNPVDDDLASVEIGWTPSGAGHGNQPVTVAASATPNNSVSISGLTPRTSYRFTLTTVDASDNRSAGVMTAAVEAPGAYWPDALSDITVTATEGVEIGADITMYLRVFGELTITNFVVGNAASEAATPTVTLSYGFGGALASAAVGTGGTSITFDDFVGMAPHIDAVLDDSNDLTGTLTAPGIGGNMLTGNAFGRFYGPNGEGLGLVFDLAGRNRRYIGARSCAEDASRHVFLIVPSPASLGRGFRVSIAVLSMPCSRRSFTSLCAASLVCATRPPCLFADGPTAK